MRSSVTNFNRHSLPATAGKKPDFKGIHDWQASDQMRPLTEQGKKQAKAAREGWFSKDVGRTNNKCLVTSGARRAAETLQVFGEEVIAKKGFFAKLGEAHKDPSCLNSPLNLDPSPPRQY
jgi:broad specificity phosphatase PhoE